MHPYEMAFTMRERHLEAHVKLNFGSLYHTVESLQREGWIEPLETSRDGRRPERTVYALTEPGREAMKRCLSQLLSEPVKEYTRFEAGLSFMHHLPAAEAATLLDERADRLEKLLDEWRFLYEVLTTQRRLTRLSLIEFEYVIGMREAELEWVRRAASEVKDGKLEWVAGYRPQQAQEVKAE